MDPSLTDQVDHDRRVHEVHDHPVVARGPDHHVAGKENPDSWLCGNGIASEPGIACPRMMYGLCSIPSFSFRTAAMSISLTIPNP